MRLYHTTTHETAILRQGFKDGTAEGVTGVWFSDRPTSVNDGAPPAGVVLELKLPAEIITEYEVLLEGADQDRHGGNRYREFVIPAEVANRYGRPRVVGRVEDV